MTTEVSIETYHNVSLTATATKCEADSTITLSEFKLSGQIVSEKYITESEVRRLRDKADEVFYPTKPTNQ